MAPASADQNVDLRREFENPCPHLKTLCLRRSRGFYNHDQRSSEPTVSDSRGRMVRSLGMAQTLLRPEQVDDLVTRYRDGATLVQLASLFGIHRRTVAEHLTRRNIPIRRGSFDPSRIHEAADLYLSGLTLAEVGVKVGAGPQAVRRALASQASRSDWRRSSVSVPSSLARSADSMVRTRREYLPQMQPHGADGDGSPPRAGVRGQAEQRSPVHDDELECVPARPQHNEVQRTGPPSATAAEQV